MKISGIYKSIVRATVGLIEDIKATTGNQDVDWWAWEQRADEDQLPKKTLIGVDGFKFDENRGLWVIQFGIGISSYKDANLLNEMEIIDVCHDHFGYDKKVELFDPGSGQEVSEMVVKDFQVMPMAQSELRNYRTLGIELLRTGNHDY